MTKSEKVIQRKLGAILYGLDQHDREVIEHYINLLEETCESCLTLSKETTEVSEGVIETAAIKRGRARGSKHFSETEINNEIFRMNKDKVLANKNGIKFHLTGMAQVLNLSEEDYQALRNRAIVNLHSKNKYNNN
jgi:hypothetical protein